MSIESKFVDSLTTLLEFVTEDSSEFYVTQGLLDQLQTFFETMRKSNPKELQDIILQWESEPILFQKLGKLIRGFYEQMKTIQSDIPSRLGMLADHNMNDASQRLHHIIDMTEIAANRTIDLSEDLLNRLENRIPSCDSTLQSIDQALKVGELNPKVKKALQKAQTTIQQEKEAITYSQEQLMSVLTAQDYQDLTGQVIHKIINLLENLEQELVELIETFGKAYVPEAPTTEETLQGPLREETLEKNSQEDVDDLLSSLGF